MASPGPPGRKTSRTWKDLSIPMSREWVLEPAGEPPPGVAARLTALRDLYAPEPVAEAKERLARERPKPRQPFEVAIARRLLELRALLDLAGHLHRALPHGRGDSGSV